MGIDNQIYNRIGDGWWDEANPLNMLNGSFTPGRFAYFRAVLDRTGRDPAGLRAVDIGCGGGFLAEEFARLGCRVVGIDPSEVSVRTARRACGCRPDLASGTPSPPVSGCPLDERELSISRTAVTCSNTCRTWTGSIERDGARPQARRALPVRHDQPDHGASKMLAIKVLQDWRLTRVIDTELHSWELFIKPTELEETLRRHGLRLGEITGLGPRANKASLLWNFIQRPPRPDHLRPAQPTDGRRSGEGHRRLLHGLRHQAA